MNSILTFLTAATCAEYASYSFGKGRVYKVDSLWRPTSALEFENYFDRHSSLVDAVGQLPICTTRHSLCSCFLAKREHANLAFWDDPLQRLSKCTDRRGLVAEGKCHVFLSLFNNLLTSECYSVNDQEHPVPLPFYELGDGKVYIVNNEIDGLLTFERHLATQGVEIHGVRMLPMCMSMYLNEFWCTCLLLEGTNNHFCATEDGSDVKIDAVSNGCHLFVRNTLNADGSVNCSPVRDERPTRALSLHMLSFDHGKPTEDLFFDQGLLDAPLDMAYHTSAFLGHREDVIPHAESGYPLTQISKSEGFYTFHLPNNLLIDAISSLEFDNHYVIHGFCTQTNAYIIIRDRNARPIHQSCHMLDRVTGPTCELKVHFDRVIERRSLVLNLVGTDRLRALADNELVCTFGSIPAH